MPPKANTASNITKTKRTNISTNPLSLPKNTLIETRFLQLPAPKKNHRNGYDVKPQSAWYKPFDFSRKVKAIHIKLGIHKIPLPAFSLVANLTRSQWEQRTSHARKANQAIRDYQLDGCNSILERKDTVVIAPTKAGKTWLFFLPVIAFPDKMSIIVTPLRGLGQAQCDEARAMGIEAIFLSGETKTSENVERAIRGEYQLIIACPETLESPTFASILHSPVVRSKLMSINVDEAHCVYEMSSWRGAYKRLDRLRSSIASIGRKIPILATSATLPCHHVSLIRDVFDVEDKYTFINLGNHRPELSTVILEMQHTASSCRDLKFLLPTTLDPKNIPPTIIYSNDIDLLYKVLDNFETWLIELGFTQNRLVDIYHAGLTKYHKNWCLNDVHAGNTRILLATEAIGMGVNLPGIRRVVQFRCAGLSYSQLVQRFGRAGRDVGGSGIGYLIIEKRMLDRTKVSVKMPKTEDPGLLQLIQSPDICCAVVADLYFENPVRPEPSPKCCSRCNPNLLPPRTYDFVLVSGCTKPITDAPQKNPDETAEDRIFVYLSIWRDEQWEKEWKAKCPSLTKSSLISNGDLQSIAQHAGKICDIEQLLDHTRIVQDVLVGNQLYCAFQEAWELEYPGLPLPRKLTDDEVAEQSLAPIVPPAPLTHALAVAPPAQPPKRPRSATIQRTTTSNLPKRARIQEK